MTKSDIKSKKGFTIIEVVLVLAVAGLIFLMAFVAVPSMQRGQRDTQRRSDMSRLLSQLSNYQANNNGKIPDNSKDFVEKFVDPYLKLEGDTFQDPATNSDYVIKYIGATITTQPSDTIGDVNVYTNASCNGEELITAGGKNRIAIKLKLEGAGWYCGHN